MFGKKLLRLGSLTLVMSMVAVSLLGGTLARYTTTVSATAEDVTAAKFKLSTSDLTETGTTTWTTADHLGATKDDDYNTTGIELYPMQTGVFSYTIDFYSDVDATIDLSATTVAAAGALAGETTGFEGADSVDLYFVVTTATGNDVATAPADYTTGVQASGLEAELKDAFAEAFGKTVVTGTDSYQWVGGSTAVNNIVTVHWSWVGTDDTADTTLGNAIYDSTDASTITVTPSITVTQDTPDDYVATALTTAETALTTAFTSATLTSQVSSLDDAKTAIETLISSNVTLTGVTSEVTITAPTSDGDLSADSTITFTVTLTDTAGATMDVTGLTVTNGTT